MMLNMANYEKLYEKDYQKLLNKYDKKSDEYKLCKIFCKYKKRILKHAIETELTKQVFSWL